MSTVASLIDFDAEECPEWRRDSKNAPSVKQMVQKITNYQIRWKKKKKYCSEKTIYEVYQDFKKTFVYHINKEEGHGCKTKEEVGLCMNMVLTSQQHLSKEERETINLIKAYEYLLAEVKKAKDDGEEESLNGLLEINLVKEVHKLVLEDIELPENATKPGEFSKNRRFTTFEGEEYEYGSPEGLEGRVLTLIDRYNDLITYSVKEEKNLEDQIYKLFKTCSWMLFNLLNEHPFSDGNGRLCRLLCSYALSFMSPFPTPIYNVWSESNKDDYIQALVHARKSKDKHPRSLTTMIIECNYYGWKKFYEMINEHEGMYPLFSCNNCLPLTTMIIDHSEY